MMTEQIKLCCDCKWYKKSWIDTFVFGSDADDKCLHPVLSGNLVTGKVKGGRYCSFVRLYSGGCGPYGKYFEPKKPHKDT